MVLLYYHGAIRDFCGEIYSLLIDLVDGYRDQNCHCFVVGWSQRGHHSGAPAVHRLATHLVLIVLFHLGTTLLFDLVICQWRSRRRFCLVLVSAHKHLHIVFAIFYSRVFRLVKLIKLSLDVLRPERKIFLAITPRHLLALKLRLPLLLVFVLKDSWVCA